MFKQIKKTIFLFLFLPVLVSAGWPLENLFIKDSFLRSHSKSGTIELSWENGRVNIQAGAKSFVCFTIPVEAGWKYFLFSMFMECKALKPGTKSWEVGKAEIHFLKKNGKKVGKRGAAPLAYGNSPAQRFRYCYEIPDGADFIQLQFCNYGIGGRCIFTDLMLSGLNTLDGICKDAPVPCRGGQDDLWDLKDAFRRTNAVREEVCLNGLWQFREVVAPESMRTVPVRGSGWGYFKVPGSWPAPFRGDGAPGMAQKIHRSQFNAVSVKNEDLNSAWYRRTIMVPDHWKGRDVFLNLEWIQSYAKVFLDGKPVGEIFYPGGKLKITDKILPGGKQELALLVIARPEESAKTVYMAPGRVMKVSGKMANRGITGDVFLCSYPSAGHLTDVHLISSVQKKTLTCDVGISGLRKGNYFLEAKILDGKKEVLHFQSKKFSVSSRPSFRFRFSQVWKNPKLWDTDTPENLYSSEITLRRADGALVDRLYPESFGFREFRTSGNRFYLNDSPIHLRTLTTSVMQAGADKTVREFLCRSVEQIRKHGYNHLIANNYNCSPGILNYPDNYYRIYSEKGMLLSLTLPHVKDFQRLKTPQEEERYRAYAEFIIRKYQNLPGIVLYAMNHNSTGYQGDQNPQSIAASTAETERNLPDGIRISAKKAAGIVKQIDPARLIYHHQSGNLSDLYTINTYLNWAPLQERCDWLELWEKRGPKPLFLVEWGMPHNPSWSSYREIPFIWSGAVKTCVWLNEFNAEFLGEDAYHSDDRKRKLYSLHEKYCMKNTPVHFSRLNILNTVSDVALVRIKLASALRDMRARGLSAFLVWDQNALWNPHAQKGRNVMNGEYACQFDRLKYPGPVPDRIYRSSQPTCDWGNEEMPLSPTGEGIVSATKECLAWIAGKPGDFTEKGHHFLPGEKVAKQLMILNDTRRVQTVAWSWRIQGWNLSGRGTVSVEPGTRKAIPISFEVPENSGKEERKIQTEFRFSNGAIRNDDFSFDAVPLPETVPTGKIGVFDPEKTLLPLLKRLNIPVTEVTRQEELARFDLLLMGRSSLNLSKFDLSGPIFNGLNVLVMEQPYEMLLQLGFRGNIHGLREVFSQDRQVIRDWRGSSTLTEPYLNLQNPFTSYPKWNWNGFTNSRVWRAGNRGNVNSVLLEKPQAGNFLPLYHAGFDLQYAPALETKCGRGRVIFSQFDICGRTELEPEALNILHSLIMRLDGKWNQPEKKTVYSGGPEGRSLLKSLDVKFSEEGNISTEDLLVLSPGAPLRSLADKVRGGLNVVALGLSGKELDSFFPGSFQTEHGSFYSDFVSGLRSVPEFDGITNAELHWRNRLTADLFPAENPGGRALAIRRIGKGRVIAIQSVPWKFDSEELQFRTTRRRNAFLISRILYNLNAASNLSFLKRLDHGSRRASAYRLPSEWKGKADPKKIGRKLGWFKPETKLDGSWRPVKVPGAFDTQFKDLEEYDGLFWYRLDFKLPDAALKSKQIVFNLGQIDDESWVWLNGTFVGELTQKTNPNNYWGAERRYVLKSELFRKGLNTVVVLCNDLRNTGGIFGIPEAVALPNFSLYTDIPERVDDPYRYYRW